MNDLTTREPANDPQDLERLLVARENAGDVTDMTALFEPDAVVEIGGGTILRGKEAIHEFFTNSRLRGLDRENESSSSENSDQRSFTVIWPSPRRAAVMVP
jgi:hypothetical protein